MKIYNKLLLEFLSYIYGKTVTFKDTKIAIEFCHAAHKYNCKEALTFCIRLMLGMINTENVIQFYETSVLFELPTIKDACCKVLVVYSYNVTNNSFKIFRYFRRRRKLF